MIVLDTCALIWWTLDPAMLSERAKESCKSMNASGGMISSISIWEIGIKIKKKKLTLGMTLHEYVRRLRIIEYLKIMPIDELLWMDNITLEWDNPDPADRTIVALAAKHDAPIITADQRIREYYPKTIW